MTLALAAAEIEVRRAEAGKVAERDEFIAVAAHELKTPITSLRLAVQMLRRESERGTALDKQKLRDSLRTIESQSQRLGRLVTELLETVRLRSGRMELDIKQTDVVDLITKAVRDAQATTTRHRLVFAAPNKLRAKLDPLRFLQVVTNLLDNAIKFSPAGGAIDVDLSSSKRGPARLAVRDRGVGIPPDDRPHIFERFYQAQSGDQRAGLGLGLYVSRQIVELHGGRIDAEFPDDGGTRIVVTLPAERS
jgi:signal transduction histidine kinase